jgi:hypothetical protein
MTAAQIMSAACSRIDESDPANPISVSNTEVLNAVNDGQMLASVLTLFLVKTVTFPLSGCFHFPRTTLTDLIVPLRISVNGLRVRPSTITELDAWNPGWQATAGAPTRYCALGSNLLAVTPQATVSAQFTYAYSPVALTPGDTPVLPPAYHPALVSWTTYALRKKEGAQSLARGLGELNAYLNAMTELAAYVRARSAAAAFDTLPMELALFDRSKLITDILKRQARSAQQGVA